MSVCGSDYDDVYGIPASGPLPFGADRCRRSCPPSPYKKDSGFHSGMLQNLSDPDATFREKAGKVITDYQYEQNNYSDSQFEVQGEGTTLLQTAPI